MILNCNKTSDKIITWIRNYCDTVNRHSLIVNLSANGACDVNSALTAILCKKTNIPTICIQTDDNYHLASKFAKRFNLRSYIITINNLSDDIYKRIVLQSTSIDHPNLTAVYAQNSLSAIADLQNSLSVPILDYFANVTNGLIIGSSCKSEIHLSRSYHKYGNRCADLMPIADLFKSEVYELFVHSARDENDHYPAVAKEIFNLSLKESDITYDELEWADRENDRTSSSLEEGIVESNEDPAMNEEFFRYTSRQQQVLAKLNQIEKATQHKTLNAPYPVLRNGVIVK